MGMIGKPLFKIKVSLAMLMGKNLRRASEMTYPYQGMIVGNNKLPKARREKYDFLDKVFKEMRLGQVFRMVLPTADIARAIRYRWLRMNTGKIMRGRTFKVPEGGCQLFVWFEEHTMEKRKDAYR